MTDRSTTTSPASDSLFGPDDLQAAARELAERTAAEQGLPPHVTDRGVLARVARLADTSSCAHEDR